MDTTGLIVVAAVLVLGTAVGWWRRRTDGRLRVPARPHEDDRLAAPGRLRVPASPSSAVSDLSDITVNRGVLEVGEKVMNEAVAGERLDPALLRALGVQPAPATLLQFSTAFCAPCRVLRRVSTEVAGLLPGVQHIDVDAESHLDAVRALGIWRTPTLLVLDADGRVTRRATGVPGKPQLIAALGEILPPA